ncbi:MAG: tetratricopeptide repeat protein [Acidobacteriota bacterium]
MSSSSFVRTTSLLVSAIVLAVAAIASGATPVDYGHTGDVEQAWIRVAEAANQDDEALLKDRTDDLLKAAATYDINRLTPMALALVVRSRALQPGEARTVLDQAARLDPGSPEVWLFLASANLRAGAVVRALSCLARGVRNLARDDRLRHVVRSSLVLSLLLAFGVVLAVWSLVAIRRVLPRLWHDLLELGAFWRLGPNRYVLAILLLGLPAFAGGDPFWLVLWVFTLAWAYLGSGAKVVGIVTLGFVGVAPTLTEWAYRALTHPPNALHQAAAALEEHRYAPALLDELSALSDVFGADPSFHLLEGDCFRQFGLLDPAAQAYREGLAAAPTDAALAFGLGTVQYLEGDFNAALHSFQIARDGGFDPLIVNFNLSLTLAQTYHFRESDEAIAAARAAGESRLRSLTRGSEQHQLLLPAFTQADVTTLLKRQDAMLLINRGLLPPPLLRERTSMSAQTVGAVVALIVAILHFLIRQRFTGFAAACVKCGRPFCRRCKLSEESQSYCSQCINIFLKKDMVAIDTQVAKRRQLARHQAVRRIESRVQDLLVPGLGMFFAGSAALGSALALIATVAAALGLVWLPRFVGPTLMGVSLWPLQTLCVLAWVAAEVAAQLAPVERR